MNLQSSYFTLERIGISHRLSTRMAVNWWEVVAFPLVFFIVLNLMTKMSLSGATLISVLASAGYTFFRFASWFYYTEFSIDMLSGRFTRTLMSGNTVEAREIITERFDPNCLEYVELHHGGQTTYLLQYHGEKTHDLLVVRTEEDKELIDQYWLDAYGNLSLA